MAPPQLTLLAEKTLPYEIKPDLLIYQARTELIAVVTPQGDVDIYRQGGQRAVHVQRKDLPGAISCMQWMSDGRSMVNATYDVHS